MPELPEVETVRLGLLKALKNRRIDGVDLRRCDLRSPFPQGFAAALSGRKILKLRRRAKYILIDLEGGMVWLVHLGMSGSFRLIPKNKVFIPEAHDHVVVTFDHGVRLVYNDPRRFGQMDVFKAEDEAHYPPLAKLGPEPLDDAFSGPVLAARLKNKKVAIKIALLDQRVLSGVGNIYACEALYRCGIGPRRKAESIKGEKADALAAAIKAVMQEALASGGSTLRDHRQLDGDTGYFQHSFAVYGHAGAACANCTCNGKSLVRSITQGGRTTFFCPVKQR